MIQLIHIIVSMQIDIRNLTKEFNYKKIINNLNVSFKPGINFIVGKNGTGKTTLFNIISGIDNNYNGTIYKDNVSINYDLIDDFNINSLSVIDNIKLVSNDIKQIDYYLDKFKLKRLNNKVVNKLSKGEKDRVSIIRTILSGDNCLLFDELTANLDPKLKRIVLSELKKLTNKIIIISTNEIELVNEYANYVLDLSNNNYSIINEPDKTIIGENILHYKNKKLILKYSFKRLLKKPFLFISLLLLTLSSTILLVMSLNIYNIDRSLYVDSVLDHYNYDYISASHNQMIEYNDNLLYLDNIKYKTEKTLNDITLAITDSFNNTKLLDNTFYFTNKFKSIDINYIIDSNKKMFPIDSKDGYKIDYLDYTINKDVVLVNNNTYRRMLEKSELNSDLTGDFINYNEDIINNSNITEDDKNKLYSINKLTIRPISRLITYDSMLYLTKNLDDINYNDIIVTNTTLYSILSQNNIEHIFSQNYFNLLKNINVGYNILKHSDRDIKFKDFNIIGTTIIKNDDNISDSNLNYIYVSDELYKDLLSYINNFNEYIFTPYKSAIYSRKEIASLSLDNLYKLELGDFTKTFNFNMRTLELGQICFYLGIALVVIGFIVIVYYYYELNKTMYKDYMILYMNHYNKKDINIINLYNHIYLLLFMALAVVISYFLSKIAIIYYCDINFNVLIHINLLSGIILAIILFVIITMIDLLFSVKVRKNKVLEVLKHE